jgi:putative transposase
VARGSIEPPTRGFSVRSANILPCYAPVFLQCAKSEKFVAVSLNHTRSCRCCKVQRLMRQIGITALYPKKNTTRPSKGHKIYPYLLKGLDINHNQVWATAITYIPMARGFLCLVAVMDWSSRKVLSWQLSNTMDNDFCVDALEEEIDRYGAPEIFNTDQGSQFTSEAFTSVLKHNDIKISLDGKDRWVSLVAVITTE